MLRCKIKMRAVNILVILVICQFSIVHSQVISSLINSLSSASTASSYYYRQRQLLDESRGFVVDWEANKGAGLIRFNISVQATNGYIAFGLSKRGQVEGADIAILSGVGTRPTLTDMYGVDNGTIAIDARQDWRLLGVDTRNGRTQFMLQRSLDTCDAQDMIINNDILHIIWRVGNSAAIPTTFTPEGDTRVYLLDPMVRPNGEPTRTWRVSRRYQIPQRRTSYWCSIHKGLTFDQRQHIVGFEAYLADDIARRHIHHQLLYRCIAPPIVDPSTIFERYINHPGEECYLESSHQLPTVFCVEIVHIFGVGGAPFRLPDNIGIPIGDNRNEYFMLETHYDNPEMRTDLVVENGVDIQYTPQLRPNEGSIVITGTGIMGLDQLPPRATNFKWFGQCSPECTDRLFPPNGVNVVATMLHAHQTTHSVRMKHWRGNEERPWINHDDNYDYSFQQVRLVPQPITVMPGDRLAVECTMDSNARNLTTLSGFSTADEMCITFLVVDRRLDFVYCSSEYPTERAIARYGIWNVTWDRELQERIVNDAANPSFVGRTLGQVIDENFPWTEARRNELVREQLYGDHYATCPPARNLVNLAYFTLFLDGLTGGALGSRARLENTRPSTRIVTTPGSSNSSMTRYPTAASVYRLPPRPCRL